jgi:hypothetical protein
MNELDVIEEKFTRCPRCRSFSVKLTNSFNFREKIKTLFIHLTAYNCDNCSHRFVEYDHFSLTYKKNWLLAVLPLVVIAVLSLILFLPGGENTSPVEEKQVVNDTTQIEQKTGTTEETAAKPPVKTTGTEISKPEDEEPPPTTGDKEPESTEETTTESVNEIVIGDSNRFGVNWSPVENGVQISRLSDGPLKRAGLEVGDVLSEVDGQPVSTGNSLLTARDEIFNGQREEAIIKVYRDNEISYYRLVKYRKENREQPENNDDELAIIDSASPAKVFSTNNIKVRTSAPDVVGAEYRWCFVKKEVKVKRQSHERVYVAGDPTGTQNWGVDDQLIINQETFYGLSRPFESNSGPLPEESKRPPQDITVLVPPDQETTLYVELIDHGKFWANTDIYIVVK